MGRRVVIKAAAGTTTLAQSRRGQPFTEEELAMLAQEVKRRRTIIYGKIDKPPQPHQVRGAWEKTAQIITSVHGIKRTADQCRKRFNDLKRRGQLNVFGHQRGRPPKNREKAINNLCAVLESKKNLEPLDLEFEIHAPIEDDPDYEPTPKKREAVRPVVPKFVVPKVVLPKLVMPTVTSKVLPKRQTQPATLPTLSMAPSLHRATSFTAAKEEEKHPFLELQQGGFNMLQRELSGFRESIVSLDSRMTQIEVLLRPIGHIADSLARIANAVERLTCPPSPQSDLN